MGEIRVFECCPKIAHMDSDDLTQCLCFDAVFHRSVPGGSLVKHVLLHAAGEWWARKTTSTAHL